MVFLKRTWAQNCNSPTLKSIASLDGILSHHTTPSTLEEWSYFYTMDYVWTSIYLDIMYIDIMHDFHLKHYFVSFWYHKSYLLILIWYVLNCFRHEARGILQKGCIHKSDWQVAVLLRLVDRTCQAHPAGIFRTFSKKGGNGGFAQQKCRALCSTELSSELKPDRILRFWQKSNGHFWLIGWPNKIQAHLAIVGPHSS